MLRKAEAPHQKQARSAINLDVIGLDDLAEFFPMAVQEGLEIGRIAIKRLEADLR